MAICRQRYEELLQKENDLNDFMETFDEQKAAKTAEIMEKQACIVKLARKNHKARKHGIIQEQGRTG